MIGQRRNGIAELPLGAQHCCSERRGADRVGNHFSQQLGGRLLPVRFWQRNQVSRRSASDPRSVFQSELRNTRNLPFIRPLLSTAVFSDVQVVWREIACHFQSLPIEHLEGAILEDEVSLGSQFLQRAIDVDARHTHRVTNLRLSNREIDCIVSDKADSLATFKKLAQKMSDPGGC